MQFHKYATLRGFVKLTVSRVNIRSLPFQGSEYPLKEFLPGELPILALFPMV